MRKAPLIGLVSSPWEHKTFSRETMGCVSEISQFVGFLPRPKAVLGTALLPHLPCDTEALSGGCPSTQGQVSPQCLPVLAELPHLPALSFPRGAWGIPSTLTDFSLWGCNIFPPGFLFPQASPSLSLSQWLMSFLCLERKLVRAQG